MGVVESYRRETFREIRGVEEMDLIRRAMARAEARRHRNRVIKEWLVAGSMVAVAVAFVLWWLAPLLGGK